MSKLYSDEYARILKGRRVSIACREGILRDHGPHIVEDVKHLVRIGVRTILFHNVAHRSANRRILLDLQDRLPHTRIERIAPEADFYRSVLDASERVFKLIFLERKSLVDPEGRRINAITTEGARETIDNFGDLINNANFKSVMALICRRIDEGHYERVHILPARRHTIQHELFTIEGSGTLIANNFSETFRPVQDDRDLAVVMGILKRYRSLGFIKPRSKAYLVAHRENIFVTLIDGIIVGCAEKLPVDDETVELGALAISTKFRNQRVGVYTVNSFIEAMARQGFRRVISLTNNPRLQDLYDSLGFVRESPPRYARRQARSPNVAMFHRTLPDVL